MIFSDALPFGALFVCRASQQRNQLREVSQPFTQCRDSRLRWSWQRDRDARASRKDKTLPRPPV